MNQLGKITRHLKRWKTILVWLSVTVLMTLVIAGLYFVIWIGPYTGTVVDSETGEHVEGASVLFYWTEILPTIIESHSAFLDVRLVYTDKDGKYEIPRVFAIRSIGGRFESTNVVIYQPGYQAYIETIWSHSKPESSFKGKNNSVKLDRIPPDFSYKEHYEKIDRALWGIDSFQYPDGAWIGKVWNIFIDRNLKSGILEKDELLRRMEWEERRSMQEYRR